MIPYQSGIQSIYLVPLWSHLTLKNITTLKLNISETVQDRESLSNPYSTHVSKFLKILYDRWDDNF